jgi:hypothetical protein
MRQGKSLGSWIFTPQQVSWALVSHLRIILEIETDRENKEHVKGTVSFT